MVMLMLNSLVRNDGRGIDRIAPAVIPAFSGHLSLPQAGQAE
jgi:hypothetical protein